MSNEAVEQVTEDAAEAAVEPEAPVERTPEEIQEEIDGRFAALRRYERDLKAKETSLQTKMSELEAKLAEYDGLSSSFRSEPDKAWEKLAEKAGMTPDEYLERVVERRTTGEPSPKELREEIMLLRKEREDERKAQAEAAQRAIEEAQQTQIHNAVAAATSDWSTHVASEEGQKEYPHLSGLSKEALETRIASGMWWAVQNPSVPLNAIMAQLDKMVEEEYSPFIQRLKGAQDQGHPAKDPGESAGLSSKKPTASSSKTISNVDQSVRSSARRPQTWDERIAAAARAIPD